MATPETASFAVAIKDESSGPADDAARALQRLRDQIDGDLKALRGMEAAMKRLKSATTPNEAAIKELGGRMAALKSKVDEGEAAFVSLGGSYTKLKRSSPKSWFADLAAAAGQAPGPLGGVTARLASLQGALAGGLLVAGLLAVAAAVVAIGVASVGAVGALGAYGVAQADAARSELLRLEALTKLRRIQGAGVGNASEMQAAIDRVSDSTALGRDKLEEYTAQLYRMGVRGANLDAALEGMAIRGAVLGDQYARGFAAMAAGAARAGRDVGALTEAVRGRLGGVAARQLLSLDVQARRLRQNFSALFRGLKIDGFLGALKGVADLFSQSTASGRAMKQILEVMFQPLLDGAEGAGPVVKRFFQGMIIAAQELTIAVLRIRIWFKRTFGDSEILANLDAARVGALAGGFAFSVLAVAVIGSVVALGLLAAAIAIPIVLLGALGYAIASVVDKAITYFQNTSWRDIGFDLVDGLTGGLLSGGARAIEAVRKLAGRLRDTLTSALQIRSPSRVFAGLGVQIPRGLAMGVEADTPRVERAVEDMVGVPSAVGVRGGAGAGVSISIGDVHVHASSTDPGEMAQSFVDKLVLALQGAGIGMGALV